MIPLASFATVIQALGFAVVHSVWQIALVWAVFKALTCRLQRHNNAIYLLALAAMFAAAVWATTTFSGECRRLAAEAEVASFEKSLTAATVSEAMLPDAVATRASSRSLLVTAQCWLEQHSAPVGWAWLLGASLLWLRFVGGWWMANKLKRQGVSAAGEAFQGLCSHWAKRLKIRQKVALLESSRVSDPLTLGFWKPVILFPIGMLAQLSPAQVEALMLHELAHIRRYDYLVNLVQLVLEVCFFYHPLFWMLSREVRTRREYCCDDVVLRHTSDPLLYAKTLTDLQLSFVHTQNHFAMNATGKNHFTTRILRIAGITPKRSLRSNWLIFLFLPLLIAVSAWWPSAQMPPEMPGKNLFNLVEPIRNPNKTIAAPANNRPDAGTPDIQTIAPAGDTVAPPYVVAASPLKMNVFYIGVDNPLRVAASGVPAGELSPRLVGTGTLTGSNGDYNVRVTQPGEVTIQVYRRQGTKETLLSEQVYRVKRIPDPTPKLGGKYPSRAITKQMLLEMPGIDVVLENFHFDAVCEVEGYELTVVPKKADPVSFNVTSGAFPPRAVEFFNSLDSLGGAVFMDDIRVKCPGDAAVRNVGGLAFKITAAE